MYTLASIDDISLVLTPIYESFEALGSWLPKLQNYGRQPQFWVKVNNTLLS